MKKVLYSLILLFGMTQLTVKADEPLQIIARPIEKVNFTPVSFKNTEITKQGVRRSGWTLSNREVKEQLTILIRSEVQQQTMCHVLHGRNYHGISFTRLR